MATPPEANVRRGRDRLLRLLLVPCGIAAAWWGCVAGRAAWGESELDAVARQIISGEPFRSERLDGLEASVAAVEADGGAKPGIIRDVAIVRLREAELELQTDHAIGGNPVFARAEAGIRRGLATSPSDGFLWFALFWLKKVQDGFTPALVPYLRLSYETAEHEGWVALRRNAQALALLPALPSDLQERAVAEFHNLVESNYAKGAAAILAGPGWASRDRLLASIEKSPQDDRVQFARALADLGARVDVPGISRTDRPWK